MPARASRFRKSPTVDKPTSVVPDNARARLLMALQEEAREELGTVVFVDFSSLQVMIPAQDVGDVLAKIRNIATRDRLESVVARAADSGKRTAFLEIRADDFERVQAAKRDYYRQQHNRVKEGEQANG